MKWRVTRSQVSDRTALIVSFPVLLALALGWFRAGTMARELSLLYAILFWLCIWLGYWAVAGGCTLALERLAPALKRRPWLLLLAGGLCASAASAFYLEPYVGLFESWLPEERLRRIAAFGSQPLITRVPQAMLNSLFGVVVWVVVNLFALRIGRPAAAQAPDNPLPTAVDEPVEIHAEAPARALPEQAVAASRLATALGSDVTLHDIIALQAQDHYVLVYLPRGKRLILYRFRDAVAELATIDGAQIHRSWWISGAAARAARREPGTLSFKIGEDLVVPVGRTWREHAHRLRTQAAAR